MLLGNLTKLRILYSIVISTVQEISNTIYQTSNVPTTIWQISVPGYACSFLGPAWRAARADDPKTRFTVNLWIDDRDSHKIIQKNLISSFFAGGQPFQMNKILNFKWVSQYLFQVSGVLWDRYLLICQQSNWCTWLCFMIFGNREKCTRDDIRLGADGITNFSSRYNRNKMTN